MASLTLKIKEFAAELGIGKIGIVPTDALVLERERLNTWLRAGMHGEMEWLAREPEKRTDPNLLFPGVRSVIVCGINYFTENKHINGPEQGKISRYAWGDDYHDVVREKLSNLLELIRIENPEIVSKICVDTAPIMDKAWAVRAGLGWLGKHSNVITKEFGSWIFIGELLLNIELEYDTVTVDDHCGSCTACLDACPTDAIIEPYVVDSRKCISYATIELRSETLPPKIVAGQEGWLYGCDICQDVCPWNRFEKVTDETRFEPREGETSLDLEKVSTMTHDEYVTRFRRSAIKRTKLNGLQRNARTLSNK